MGRKSGEICTWFLEDLHMLIHLYDLGVEHWWSIDVEDIEVGLVAEEEQVLGAMCNDEPKAKR